MSVENLCENRVLFFDRKKTPRIWVFFFVSFPPHGVSGCPGIRAFLASELFRRPGHIFDGVTGPTFTVSYMWDHIQVWVFLCEGIGSHCLTLEWDVRCESDKI